MFQIQYALNRNVCIHLSIYNICVAAPYLSMQGWSLSGRSFLAASTQLLEIRGIPRSVFHVTISLQSRGLNAMVMAKTDCSRVQGVTYVHYTNVEAVGDLVRTAKCLFNQAACYFSLCNECNKLKPVWSFINTNI